MFGAKFVLKNQAKHLRRNQARHRRRNQTRHRRRNQARHRRKNKSIPQFVDLLRENRRYLNHTKIKLLTEIQLFLV